MDQCWSLDTTSRTDGELAHQDETISSSRLENRGSRPEINTVQENSSTRLSLMNAVEDWCTPTVNTSENTEHHDDDHEKIGEMKKSRRKQGKPSRMSQNDESETPIENNVKIMYSQSGQRTPRFPGYSDSRIEKEEDMSLFEGTGDQGYSSNQHDDYVDRPKKSRKQHKPVRVSSDENDDDGTLCSSDDEDPAGVTQAILDVLAQLGSDDAELSDETGQSRKRRMKRFQCSFCAYSGKDNYALVRHMRSHAGDRPYHCRSCSESFKRPDGLRRHISKAHPDKAEELTSFIHEDYNAKLKEVFLSSFMDFNRSTSTGSREHPDLSTRLDIPEKKMSKVKPVGFVSPISNETVNSAQTTESIPSTETRVSTDEVYSRSMFPMKKPKKQLYVVLNPIDLHKDYKHLASGKERGKILLNSPPEKKEASHAELDKVVTRDFVDTNSLEPSMYDSSASSLPPHLDKVVDNQKYSTGKSFTSDNLSPPTLEPVEQGRENVGSIGSRFEYESDLARDVTSGPVTNPYPVISVGVAMAEESHDEREASQVSASQSDDNPETATASQDAKENLGRNVTSPLNLKANSCHEFGLTHSDDKEDKQSIEEIDKTSEVVRSTASNGEGELEVRQHNSTLTLQATQNSISTDCEKNLGDGENAPNANVFFERKVSSGDETESADEESGEVNYTEMGQSNNGVVNLRDNMDDAAVKSRGVDDEDANYEAARPGYSVPLIPLKEKSDSLSSLETLSKLQSIAVQVDATSKGSSGDAAVEPISEDGMVDLNQRTSAEQLAADGNLSLHQLLAKSRFIPEADNAKVDVKVKKPMSAKVSDIVRVAASIKQDIATHRHHMHTCREDLSDFKSEMEFLVRSKNFQIGTFSVTAKVRHLSSGQLQVAYECPLCRHLFTSYKGLNFHYRRKHKDDSMQVGVIAKSVTQNESLSPEDQFFLDGPPQHQGQTHARPVSAAMYLGRLAKVNRTFTDQRYQNVGPENPPEHHPAVGELQTRQVQMQGVQLSAPLHFQKNAAVVPSVQMHPVHQHGERINNQGKDAPHVSMPALQPDNFGRANLAPTHIRRTVNETNAVDLSRKTNTQQSSAQMHELVVHESMRVHHPRSAVQTTNIPVFLSNLGLQSLQKGPQMSPGFIQHQVQTSPRQAQQEHHAVVYPPGYTYGKPVSASAGSRDTQGFDGYPSNSNFVNQHMATVLQSKRVNQSNLPEHHFQQLVSSDTIGLPVSPQFTAPMRNPSGIPSNSQSGRTSARDAVVDLSIRKPGMPSENHQGTVIVNRSTCSSLPHDVKATREYMPVGRTHTSINQWCPVASTHSEIMSNPTLLNVPVYAHGQQPVLIPAEEQPDPSDVGLLKPGVTSVTSAEGNQAYHAAIDNLHLPHLIPQRCAQPLPPKSIVKDITVPIKHTVDLSVRPKPKFLTPAPGKPFSKIPFGRFKETFGSPVSALTKQTPQLKVPNPVFMQRQTVLLDPQSSRINTTNMSSPYSMEKESMASAPPHSNASYSDSQGHVQTQILLSPHHVHNQHALQFSRVEIPRTDISEFVTISNEPGLKQMLPSPSQAGRPVLSPSSKCIMIQSPMQPRGPVPANTQVPQMETGKQQQSQSMRPTIPGMHMSTPNVRMLHQSQEQHGSHDYANESRPDMSKVSEEISNMASLVNRLPPSEIPRPLFENSPFTTQDGELPAVYAKVLGVSGRMRPVREREAAVDLPIQPQLVNRGIESPLDLTAKPKQQPTSCQSEYVGQNITKDQLPTAENPIDLTVKAASTSTTADAEEDMNQHQNQRQLCSPQVNRSTHLFRGNTEEAQIQNPALLPTSPRQIQLNSQQVLQFNQMIQAYQGRRMPPQVLHSLPSTVLGNIQAQHQLYNYPPAGYGRESKPQEVPQERILTTTETRVKPPSGHGFMFKNMPIITDVRSLQETDPQAPAVRMMSQAQPPKDKTFREILSGKLPTNFPDNDRIRHSKQLLAHGIAPRVAGEPNQTSNLAAGPLNLPPNYLNKQEESTSKYPSSIGGMALDLTLSDGGGKSNKDTAIQSYSNNAPDQVSDQHITQPQRQSQMLIPMTKVPQRTGAESIIMQPRMIQIQVPQISPRHGIVPVRIPQSPQGSSVDRFMMPGVARPPMPGQPVDLQLIPTEPRSSDALPVLAAKPDSYPQPMPSPGPAEDQRPLPSSGPVRGQRPSSYSNMPETLQQGPTVGQPVNNELNLSNRPSLISRPTLSMRPPILLRQQAATFTEMPPPLIPDATVIETNHKPANQGAPPTILAGHGHGETEKDTEGLVPQNMQSPSQSPKSTQMIQANDISSSEGSRKHGAAKANQEVSLRQCKTSTVPAEETSKTPETKDENLFSSQTSTDESEPPSNTSLKSEQTADADSNHLRPKRRRLSSYESGITTTTKKDDPSSDAEILKSFVKTGKHKCPFCFFSNYSRKEVRIHIKQEHFNKQKKSPDNGGISCDNMEMEESAKRRNFHRQESQMSSISEVSHSSGLTCESYDYNSDVETNIGDEIAAEDEETTADMRDDDSLSKSSEASKYSESNSVKDNVGNNLTCTKCLRDFASVAELDEHCRMVHDGKGLSQHCPVCAFASDDSYVMHKHMEQYHSGHKPYQCEKPDCSRSFTTLEDLHRHSRRHDADKKFTCDLCGAKYHWQNGLRAHMLRHTVNYPYECSHCGLRFKTSGMLKRHEYEKKHLPPEAISKAAEGNSRFSRSAPETVRRRGRGRGYRK